MARSLIRANSDKILIGQTNSTDIRGNNYSFAAWTKLSSNAAGDKDILTRWHVTPGFNGCYYFVISTDQYSFFSGNGGVGVSGGASCTTHMSTGVWYHGAFCTDATNQSGYTNGVRESFTGAGLSIGVNTENTIVGAVVNNPVGPTYQDSFDGSLADVAAWNVRLTDAEVAALANGARPWMIRESNLVAWWPLDGLQSPEPDLSGNASNGTLTGTAKASGPPLMQFTPRWPQFSELPPTAQASMIFSQQIITIPLLMTVPISVTLHNP